MFFRSFALMGLAALAIAAPHPDVPIGERGLTWEPRGLDKRDRKNHNNNNDLTIVDTTFIQIDEKSRGQEQELTILIKEKIVVKDNSNNFRDNVRRNHYKNKNRDVNTVIIIITEVIDIRDSSNRNNRYLQRQIRADNKQSHDTIIMVTEVVAITIDSNSRNGNSGNGTGQGNTAVNSGSLATAASAAAPIMTISPNATYSPSNLTMILPSGAPPPSISGVSTEFDPAAIIEVDQALFVEQAS